MENWPVYLDDVIIFSPQMDAQVGNVERILGLIQKSGVTLKLSKCSLLKNEVYFLGNTIMPGKFAS